MRRVIVIAAAGLSLAGCSSMDAFKSTPPTLQVPLESAPPGADARTSAGPGCKTPCSVTIPAPDLGFTVTYTLNRFETTTVPVQVITGSGSTTIDPNPVFAELRPLAPPPKPVKKMMRPKNPKPPKAAAQPMGSPFPEPALPPRSTR
jgi:hypothetical protein